jgi:hypothetical protein
MKAEKLFPNKAFAAQLAKVDAFRKKNWLPDCLINEDFY